MASEFHLFPTLPPEIRHQIWLEALSNAEEPGETPLFYFKKGCWQWRHIQPEEPGYEPGDENLYLGFEHDRLDPLRYDHPLFHVNWEARSAARSWTKSHSQNENRSCRENQEQEQEQIPLLMTRAFNPDRDTLYVSVEECYDLIVEPMEKPFDDGIVDISFSSSGPSWSRLAIPFVLLKDDPNGLAELFLNYMCIRTIFLIVKAEPDEFWAMQRTDRRGGQWWEVQSLESAPEARFYRDGENEFRWEGYTADLDQYQLREVSASAGMEMLRENSVQLHGAVEFRPARVVRKCI